MSNKRLSNIASEGHIKYVIAFQEYDEYIRIMNEIVNFWGKIALLIDD